MGKWDLFVVDDKNKSRKPDIKTMSFRGLKQNKSLIMTFFFLHILYFINNKVRIFEYLLTLPFKNASVQWMCHTTG